MGRSRSDGVSVGGAPAPQIAPTPALRPTNPAAARSQSEAKTAATASRAGGATDGPDEDDHALGDVVASEDPVHYQLRDIQDVFEKGAKNATELDVRVHLPLVLDRILGGDAGEHALAELCCPSSRAHAKAMSKHVSPVVRRPGWAGSAALKPDIR